MYFTRIKSEHTRAKLMWFLYNREVFLQREQKKKNKRTFLDIRIASTKQKKEERKSKKGDKAGGEDRGYTQLPSK
jgi:hypothetical protein